MELQHNEPYITDEGRAYLGHETVVTSHPVSARHIQQYLAGADNWDLAYHDPDYCKKSPHGEIVAPPIFFLAASRRIVPMDQLQADGQYSVFLIPGVYGRSLLASWDIEVFDVVRVGDVITVRDKITKISEKQGRSGKMIIVEKTGEHHNQHGTLIGRDTQTVFYI